jgi:hypothetical protein
MRTEAAARPYATGAGDAVRDRYERRFFGALVPRLLRAAGGERALLDLGSADGLAAELSGPGLGRYLGVDLDPPGGPGFLCHDLREGLGPVGGRPFDLYLGTFGVASHVSPSQLRRLLLEIAAHGRPGSVVALEALGLRSLEWPGLWSRPPGEARTIPYRLGTDVSVHPWLPGELAALFDDAGMRPLLALDRTLQAGPKTGGGRYFPGLPDVRGALNAALAGVAEPDGIAAPLPPLPAGEAAAVHHELARRRRELCRARRELCREPRERSVAQRERFDLGDGASLADAVWALEPPTAGGYGHGLMVVGRIP